ncbi:MAG: hypothetical protein H7144_01485 [Burkholderiales bacterium]|nr:hypothetical protein [Phycisphaerae bacterium]
MIALTTAVTLLALTTFTAIAVAQDTPSSSTAPTTIPAALPGNGLSQHDFLYAGEWDTRKPVQTAFIIRGGKVVWSFEIPSKKGEISDASLLSNGNVIIGHQHGALVVTQDKKVIWTYECPPGTEVHTIQAIGLDKVMIFSNGPDPKVMLFDIKTNAVESSFSVPVGNLKSTHGQCRHMRITPGNTLLIAHMDNKEIGEYTLDGKKIGSTMLEGGVWSAVRLRSGNTLASTKKTQIVELDPSGKIVWELAPSDIPEIKLHNIQEVARLDNGNTVFTNWVPGSAKAPQWPGTVQVVEVTPSKKVVWALSEWSDPDLGPATCIQLLDQSGKAEEHTIQR